MEIYKTNSKTVENFPLVSVIITAFNEEMMISDCLKAILSQTYSNFEIIYIDAKSTDKTIEKANEIKSKQGAFSNCKRFVVMSKDAKSPAIGRNLGVKMANGQIIAFTDADCIVDKDWLVYLILNFKKDVGAVGGPNILRHFKESKIINVLDEVLGSYLGSSGAPQFFKIKKTKQVYGIPSCNMAISKKLFDELNGFDEKLRYNEDTDLCYRITVKGYKIIYVPNAKIEHYMGIDSLTEFNKIIYKYGLERGKNIKKNTRLFTKFHAVSIVIISIIASTSILTIWNDAIIIIPIIIIISGLVVVGVNSLFIGLRTKSIEYGFLSFFFLIGEYCIYNVGFMRGLINR